MSREELVVSLSSIPPRFGRIGATLRSLVAQEVPVSVELQVPRRYRRFPDWDGTLPEVPDGVTIRRVEEDWGPATKLLGALAGRAEDARILFCDDDQHYPPDWAARFLALERDRPNAALALLGMQAYDAAGGSRERALQPRATRRWRVTDLEFQLRFLWQDLTRGRGLPSPGRRVVKRSGYADIFEGRGGVLVRPAFFPDDVFDVPAPCWTVDDVWLSACVALQGVPIWVQGGYRDPTDTEAEAVDPLCRSDVGGTDRAAQNRAAIEYLRKTYGIWR
ncbi:glycosyltransferase family 2 protein [Psychromarinibacter sp. C21-152]|uniref:Glycosyltransferase family 2 protein n=1 Tax=Psychromarinibacter sediminicola TaxID=3033385 RepID=A0AAE3T800_9RHOB|nr:glycosyltransferase family 2 protein [Psychromarinibacter sediminicola]MDF0599559.1 glycosyltransferase family 2 protein [Psychromarinibacter sediminicola]